MANVMSFRRISILFAIVVFLPCALCHMEMSWPYALRSKYNPENNAGTVDYNMMAPLEAGGSDFPCKGYQNDRPIAPVVTYAAGSTYNMTLAGSATHGGGSCQMSLSYDNGATFRVIKSMIGGCPLQSTYDFSIPSYAPAGDALLAWTWQNKIGNREFYMNCASVKIITGGMNRSVRRQQKFGSMGDLPFIWKANLEGLNTCETEEGTDPVYPEPGPDVEYGDGISSSSETNVGNCNAPKPFGQTYKPMADRLEAIAFAGLDDATTSASNGQFQTSTAASVETPTSMMTGATLTSQFPSSVFQATSISQLTSSPSTTTVTVDCPSTVTIVMTPSSTAASVYTTSVIGAACTGTSAACPCAPGYACQSIGECTWACRAQSTLSTLRQTAISTSATAPSASIALSRPATSVSPSLPTTTSSNSVYVAPGDLGTYLPCVPGTFICTSETKWYTCDYDANGNYVYAYPRGVSAGMMCLPNDTPYSSNTGVYGQQGSEPDGYYRDDRIVRERPYGYCTQDGQIRCSNGGSGFQVCDQGGWVDMGNVAPGTTCKNDEIVAA